MDPLTKEQKEYMSLKRAFDRMLKNYQDFRDTDGNQCIPEIYNNTVPEAEFKIESVFKNLLDTYYMKKT